jgi:FlaA1/EpsC-like NDP-sugar epimerase
MAFCFATGFDEHLSRRDRAGGLAPGARLCAGGAERARAVLLGKITIVLYWILQMAFLGGPRIAYRYYRYARTRHDARSSEANPTLVLGRAADAEVLPRAIESGAVKKIRPIGILSPAAADQGQAIRGIPVLGGFDALDRVVNERARRGTPGAGVAARSGH